MSKDSIDFANMPLGFGFALIQNEQAMRNYAFLPPQEREKVVEEARRMQSKQTMALFISDLAQRSIQP